LSNFDFINDLEDEDEDSSSEEDGDGKSSNLYSVIRKLNRTRKLRIEDTKVKRH
jgi:hypothetical protein